MATEPKPAKDTTEPENGFWQYDQIGPLPEGWKLPTHLDLPESDGEPVENFGENPQGALISQSLEPILKQRHPDKQYCIGQNSGIYWMIAEKPLKGAIVPDWFYVPDVPPMLEGEYRRSYVMWQEKQSPMLVLEFVSRSGDKERDDTPLEGKFWIYEQAVKANYYGIFDSKTETLELYRLTKDKYERVPENERGHCPVPELGIEFGIWEGEFQNMKMPWLRVWDAAGNLLTHANERTEEYRQQAQEHAKLVELERMRAEEERQHAEQERLGREQERQRAEQEKQRAEQEKQRAEQEKQRAEQEKQRAEKLAAHLRSLGIDPGTVQ